MNLASALAALYARIPLGMRLGLEAMEAACAATGHPEHAFPVLHVAGTNGKGSTAAMLEAIARASGARTGLYTSPHLCRFAERIRIDGEPITDSALTTMLERALAIEDLSFFEAATLAAFLAFREAKVDVAIVEVGIGGRLDATNVVATTRVACVTRIALDHQDRLGATLPEIAREKAAIARRGAPIVLGRMPPAVRAAARETAIARGGLVMSLDDEPEVDLPPVGLAGLHQRENAAVAWRVAELAGFDEAARRSGLAKARWPGRLESITEGGIRYVLDGAHNPDGAVALARALERPRAIVFGALADKDWRGMLAALAVVPAPRFYAAPRGRAAVPPEMLAQALPGTPCASAEEALRFARAIPGDGPIVVCGSLYLVGHARALLLGLPEDPPVAL